MFFSVCVVSLVSGIYVLQNNHKAAANRIFFALIIAINFWSIGLALATSAPNVETCLIWRRVSAVGWGTAYAIILHFALIISGKKKLLQKKWFYFCLYIPAFITIMAFAVPSGINPVPYQLQLTKFGWINIARFVNYDIWDWIFTFYYIGYTLTALLVVFFWGKKSTERNVKIQSRFIFLSFITVFILATITDIFLGNVFGKMPQIAPITMLIPITVIHLMIKKYGFIIPKTDENKGSYANIAVSVILYIIIAFLLSGLAAEISVFNFLHITDIAAKGIMTQLQMLISIYLVIKESKSGFIAAILLNIISLFGSISVMFHSQSTESVPGIFSYLTAFIVIMLIDSYKKDTTSNIEKINRQRKTLEQSEKKLFQMAYYDSLTELHNRDWFVDHLNQSIHVAKQNDTLIGVIFVDLDGFKAVNDTMGHSIGDEVLRVIAGRLLSCLREYDALARFGGDEFLIMVPQIEKINDLQKVSDRIISVFDDHISINDMDYYITASVGVAIYPFDGEDSEMLIKNADIAMYSAKSKGKNQCVYCSHDIKNDTVKNLNLTNNLYRALEKNELYLHYQPIVKTDTKEIIGLEALLRWKTVTYGNITPDIFIPIAEQTGLIRPIGLWVMKNTCQQLQEFRKCCDENLTMSINLSLEQLKDAFIADKIKQILNETKTDPNSIRIEITESIAFNEDPYVLQRLKEIRNLGISIAIDDFGTGFSSFTRLKTFPIDMIKIDMDFVQGISSDSYKDKSIIKSIIHLAKNLGIDVLAEGVETEEQFVYLSNNECHFIQGYYFYKPMAPNDIKRIFKKKRS